MVPANSRSRIDLCQAVAIEPNQSEASEAHRGTDVEGGRVEAHLCAWATRLQRPIFCTRGERGILLALPQSQVVSVPAYTVTGSIDVVGAGDSVSAGIACAVAAGAPVPAAAAFGNLVASITIQQIGTTGTATPEQVLERWRQVSGR